MARLLIIRGAELGIEYELDDVTRIGRSSKSTIQLLDPSVSRHHAGIERKGNDFYIENLSGTTDVLVNNVPVRGSTRLRDNDEIGIGQYGFVFNPGLTMVRARFGDQVLVISPHRPEEMDLGEKKKQGEGALREKSLRALGAIYEHCLYIDDITQCLGRVLEEVMEL
ncbi:MAG: FHA domain-containing protein, partial [Pseudomonadota bacterium]